MTSLMEILMDLLGEAFEDFCEADCQPSNEADEVSPRKKNPLQPDISFGSPGISGDGETGWSGNKSKADAGWVGGPGVSSAFKEFDVGAAETTDDIPSVKDENSAPMGYSPSWPDSQYPIPVRSRKSGNDGEP